MYHYIMSHEKSFWPIANPIIVNEKSYCILMSSCLGQRKFSVNEKSYRILMSPCLGQRKSSSTRNRQSRNHIIFWCLGQRYHLPGEHHRQREMGNPNNICLEKSSSTRNRQSRKHLPREIIVMRNRQSRHHIVFWCLPVLAREIICLEKSSWTRNW